MNPDTSTTDQLRQSIEKGQGEVETSLESIRQLFDSDKGVKERLGTGPLCVFMEGTILIVWPSLPALKVWVRGPGRFFRAADVEFLGNPKVAGTYAGPLRLTTFIKTEIKLNWAWVFSSFIFLLILGAWVESLAMLRVLDLMLVTAVAFWVAMFAVVAPGRYQQARARSLFQNGLLYRQFTNDQFLGRTAAVSLVSAVLATAVSYGSTPTVTICGVGVDLVLLASTILTSFSGALATLCFVSIYNYYLEQAKAVEYAVAAQEIVKDFIQK